MKFTNVLNKHHIGRAMRAMWQYHRNRIVIVTKAEQILTSMGFNVQDALEFTKPKIERTMYLFLYCYRIIIRILFSSEIL